MKIMIADDSVEIRRVMADHLAALGHEVTLAANGTEAWELLQREPFHVVLADWNLSAVQGTSLCQRIRGLPRPAYTYVLLLVPPDQDRVEDGLEAGADDFVAKPIRLAELLARVSVADRLVRLQGRVARLEAVLSICSHCKRIKDERSQWVNVDRYIAGRTGVAFSHGICPTCVHAEYEDEYPIAVGG